MEEGGVDNTAFLPEGTKFYHGHLMSDYNKIFCCSPINEPERQSSSQGQHGAVTASAL